jgi:hypothetical protein
MKTVKSLARLCKKNVKIRENANCGADTLEMKYSGHISDQKGKLHYEGGIYQQILHSVLKIFMDEGSHAKC